MYIAKLNPHISATPSIILPDVILLRAIQIAFPPTHSPHVAYINREPPVPFVPPVDSLTNGLLAAYGSDGQDYSGNGNSYLPFGPGPAPGLIDGIDGSPGEAMSVDGINYYQLDGAVIPQGSPFTVSGFFKVLSPANAAVYGGGVTMQQQVYVETAPGGPLALVVRMATGGADPQFQILVEFEATSFTPPNFYSLNPVNGAWADWHHLVVSWDGTTMKFYFDAVLVATAPLSRATGHTPLHTTLGGNGFPQSPTGVQYKLVYNRALTDGGVTAGNSVTADSEIGRLWNSGIGFSPVEL